MQPTKTRQTITQKTFYSINRSIKEALKARTYSSTEIAKFWGVSPETVRAIRRAGTWPQFIRDKETRRARVVNRTGTSMAEAEMSAHLDKLNSALTDEPKANPDPTLEQRVRDLELGLKDETKRAVQDVSEVHARVGRLDRTLREVKEVLPGRWLRRLNK